MNCNELEHFIPSLKLKGETMILKFCGIKTKVEALSIRPLNINMVGFIHYPKVNDIWTLNK